MSFLALRLGGLKNPLVKGESQHLAASASRRCNCSHFKGEISTCCPSNWETIGRFACQKPHKDLWDFGFGTVVHIYQRTYSADGVD